VHDVALKQLIALSEPPPWGDGIVALVHAGPPFQVSTRLAPPEEPTAVQKLGPAHDTEERESFVGGSLTGIVPVHEDPFHRSANA
jgi:hypothetical protein